MTAIVSNMPVSCSFEIPHPLTDTPRAASGSCAPGSRLRTVFQVQLKCRRRCVAVLFLIALATPVSAWPQTTAIVPPAQQNEERLGDIVKFFAGSGVAFAGHEAAHLWFDLLFDAHAYVKDVHFGRVPFFAIAHEQQSSRREFLITSAGFWTQEATSEWLLTRHPHLREEHAPFSKGVLAFDVLTALGYGIVALFKAGPYERDTRGMAQAIGVDERAIG